MSDSVSDVTQLVLKERQSRDRGWFDRMNECYADDSVVDMSWFVGPGAEFVRRSKVMSESAQGWGGLSVHRLAPITVQVNGDRAWAEVPLAIEFRITVNGVEADLVSYCRNQIRARRDGSGRWQIVRFTSIYEKDSVAEAVPGTDLGLDAAEFTRFRPSYRCLAWYHRGLGLELRDDLLGDDQPERVAEQYRAEVEWLAGARDLPNSP